MGVRDDPLPGSAGDRLDRSSPDRVPAQPLLDDVESMFDMLPLSASEVAMEAFAGVGAAPLVKIEVPEPTHSGQVPCMTPEGGAAAPAAASNPLPPHLGYLHETLSGNSSPMSGSDAFSDFPPSPEFHTSPEDFVPFMQDAAAAGGDGLLVEDFDVDGASVKQEGLDMPMMDVPPSPESEQGALTGRPAKRTKSGRREVSLDRGGGSGSRGARRQAMTAAQDPALEESFDESGLSKDEIKKRRRMLKNRQSASLSRKRKKEYLESLEEQNRALSDENAALKRGLATQTEANEALRAQLLRFESAAGRQELGMLQSKAAALERENTSLRLQLEQSQVSSGHSTTFRTGTVLMACLFCFALFTRPGAPSASVGGALAPATAHYGRTLKSVSLPSGEPIKLLGSTTSLTRRRTPRRLTAPDMSPELAASEAAIPDGNLDGWLAAHEARLISQLNDTVAPPGTELVRRDPNTDRHVPHTLKLGGGYASMINTVRRRTDTSYVFCSEVQIMSAVSASGASKPKVSFIMPAENSADGSRRSAGSNGTEFSTLLQINCDVSSTETLRAGSSTNASVV